MFIRIVLALSLLTACVLTYLASQPADACCPAGPRGKPVVNADQTVIILWDAAEKMQHFIRQASFKSDADDFGFLVPSPSQPRLEESGNDAFPYLLKLTEPEIVKQKRPTGGGGGCIGCSMEKSDKAAPAPTKSAPPPPVTVLEQKQVAGFDAAVLETTTTKALIKWLEDHGYAFSPEIEAWAKPYIDQNWKITALKVAKGKDNKDSKTVGAAALRISFKTERPVFPYREPDYKSAADALGAKSRMLRIYFLADGRYEGELTKEQPWSAKVAWSGKVDAADKKKLLEQLKLPDAAGPKDWWLTEFEDNWRYAVAPADVYFSRSANQDALKREPIVQYVSAPYPTDATSYALAAVLIVPPLWLRVRRWWRGENEA